MPPVGRLSVPHSCISRPCESLRGVPTADSPSPEVPTAPPESGNYHPTEARDHSLEGRPVRSMLRAIPPASINCLDPRTGSAWANRPPPVNGPAKLLTHQSLP